MEGPVKPDRDVLWAGGHARYRRTQNGQSHPSLPWNESKGRDWKSPGKRKAPRTEAFRT
jgi:hypothetical protein